MSVKVAVRVRPFNSRERSLGCECVVDMSDPSTTLKPYQGEEERRFTFDYSFWSFDQYKEDENGYLTPTSSKYADQKQVFERIGKSILDNAWQGYHCCLFAYGQTGSGKSYSMIGYGPNKGIVPITCNEIFQRIKLKEEGQEFQVRASMLEIYNEEIQDLTIPISSRVRGGLKIRQNKLLGVYVDGVKKHLVTSFVEIQNVMAEGTKNRTVASTQMNATSSRAHTIITVEFIQKKKVGEAKSQKVSMINLVDLAGSERQDKTGATGQRLKEAVGINQSLTSLGQVISVLAKNSEGGNDYVPYRNSALTRILQNALGGNSQTIMICAISPANDNYDESLSTLRYADRAKKIKNKPVVNESESDKMIRQLKEQNDRLKKLLQGKGGASMLKQPQQQEGGVDEEALKQKEEEFKKRQEQLLKKQQEQAQKLKQLEAQLAEKDKQKQQLLQKQEEEIKALEEKIKAEEDEEQVNLLKEEQDKKKKEEEQTQNKILEQQQALLLQQKQQQKMLSEQHLLLQKSQEDYKKFMEEMQKERQRKQGATNQEGGNRRAASNEDYEQSDEDEEDVQAKISAFEKLLLDMNKTEEEKKKEADRDQKQLKKENQDEGLKREEDLKEVKEKQGSLPPYFENISKDIMINRKLKILLRKSLLTVGKVGCHPANDIIFGGRDVNMKHATLHVIEGKVFLKAISSNSHLYVNGKRVEDTIELANLDRVIFGWNSVYLFKNVHDNKTDEKIRDRDITWDFVRDEMKHMVDIDQSDTEEGADGGCCKMF